MRFSVVAAGVLTLILPACATFFGGNRSDRYETGLAALRSGDFARARENLAWVAENKSSEEVGRRALLVVSAIDMDPRNPARRLALGSDLVATYLRNDEADRWTDPVAQTLYLLALELGAADDKVAQAEAEAAAVHSALSNMPTLPKGATTAPAKIKAISEEKDKLAKKVEQLESQLKDRETKLAEKEKELERIRKTLKG